MPYQQISSYNFNCNACHTRCDGTTVPQFDFERDVRFSEKIENRVISYINASHRNLAASKCADAGYPDIQICSNGLSGGDVLCYIEIKGQARTFMSVAKLLPKSGLHTSETLALNLSDLERYFTIFDKTGIRTFIVWCLMRRPCITGNNFNNTVYFHQDITILRKIRRLDVYDSRKFRRASGTGDIVNGEHKGVTVNYHFSINELIPGLPKLQCNQRNSF